MKTSFFKKSIRILLITANLIIIAFVFAFSGIFFPREEQALAPPLKKKQIIQYESEELKRQDIEDSLKVRAYAVSSVKTEVNFTTQSGYLKSLLVSEGDYVVEGQLLARLESQSLESDIKRQQLMLKAAEENLEKYRKLSIIDIKLLESGVEELQAEVDSWQDRMDNISEYDYRKLVNNLEKQQLSLEKSRIDSEFQISSLERQIALESLKLDNLQTDFDKTRLRAPNSGKVEYIALIKPGEWVDSHSRFITLADQTRLTLNYNGSKYGEFIKGMEVRIEYKQKEYTGRVLITPNEVADEDRDKFSETIKFEFDTPPEELKAGDSAQIFLVKDRSENALVLPKRYVHNYIGRKYVRVLQNGLVIEKDVELGIETSTEYEILKGLEEGEQVVE